MLTLPLRALLRQTSECIYRWNYRCASHLGKVVDIDDKSRDSRYRSNDEPHFSDLEAKVYPCRGTSAETFGDLSEIPEVPADFVEGDKADSAEGTTYSREQDRETRRVHYSKLIAELLAEKKLSMALAVLEDEMKGAKAKPDRKIFADLITFCGKVGYPQKAFSLFNQMKKRGYGMTGGIYTSLFNACANCPLPHIGLKYAQRLKGTMDNKGWKPNVITYHAMIKAFGRSGDMETAFSLADEMMRDKLPLEIKTMSFLLQACISNKVDGFLRALQVWHKMHQFRFKPDVYSYKLLLRSTRDCGIGDLESLNTVLKTLIPGEESLKIAAKEETDPKAGRKCKSEAAYPWEEVDQTDVTGFPVSTEVQSNSDESREVLISVPATRPDLLAPKPTLGGLVITDEIKAAADRLLLLGGSKRVIDSMLADGLQPDIATFTLLLDCIPQTIAAEEALLREIQANRVEPDAGFFNALIYRRGRRKDFSSGFDVLEIMKRYDVGIDNITIHSLAYCVADIPNFYKFLDDIKEAGFSPTPPMLGSILKNAFSQTHFKFIHAVMDAYQDHELPVHKSTLDQMDEFYKKNLRIYKGKDTVPDWKQEFYSGQYFRVGMQLFIVKRADWMRRVKLDETSDADYHEQFKKTGKEVEQLEPYIQKWKKGSRYTPWRERRPAQQTK